MPAHDRHRAALAMIAESERSPAGYDCPATMLHNVQVAWCCPLPRRELMSEQDAQLAARRRRRGAVPDAVELAVAEAFDAVPARAATLPFA